MTKQQKINLISTILLIGFSLGIYYHFVIMGVYKNKPYPFNSFLHDPNIVFSDIKDKIFNTKDLKPYLLGPFGSPDRHTISEYFPFSFIFLYPFSLISSDATLFIFFITFIGTILLGNYNYLKEGDSFESLKNKTDFFRNVFVFTFLTFPFLFEIDRANTESFLLMCDMAFLFYYQKNKAYKAALFLGLSAAMKFYTGVFYFLFLKDKKYKELFFGLVFTILITILSLALMKGGMIENINGFVNEMNLSKSFFGITASNIGITQTSSLFAPIKIVMLVFGFDSVDNIKMAFRFFCILTAIVGIGLFSYLMKYNDSLWKMLMILTCCMLLFNFVTFDYKLIHLFIPLWLFLNQKDKSKYDIYYSILFALLLTPIEYRILPHGKYGSYDISVILNPIFMIAFVILIIKEGINAKYLQKRQA